MAKFWLSFVEALKNYVVIPFMNIDVWDVIDILFLALILYRCYIFIHDRRAGQLTIGVLMTFFVLGVAYMLKLPVMSFVAKKIAQVLVVALLIIFQPEVRDGLEKIGVAPQKLRSSNQSRSLSVITSAIGEISEAVCEMSKERTGALIVIERNIKLGDYIATGVDLDAKLSNQLLRNIFFNKSPLHDGAVIIRDYKIISAACILPASKNDAVFSDMGTRHRAALGISELSDAVTIVVSEETGIISIANNGIMKRGYNSGSIKEDLFLLLTGNTSKEVERLARLGHR